MEKEIKKIKFDVTMETKDLKHMLDRVVKGLSKPSGSLVKNFDINTELLELRADASADTVLKPNNELTITAYPLTARRWEDKKCEDFLEIEEFYNPNGAFGSYYNFQICSAVTEAMQVNGFDHGDETGSAVITVNGKMLLKLLKASKSKTCCLTETENSKGERRLSINSKVSIPIEENFNPEHLPEQNQGLVVLPNIQPAELKNAVKAACSAKAPETAISNFRKAFKVCVLFKPENHYDLTLYSTDGYTLLKRTLPGVISRHSAVLDGDIGKDGFMIRKTHLERILAVHPFKNAVTVVFGRESLWTSETDGVFTFTTESSILEAGTTFTYYPDYGSVFEFETPVSVSVNREKLLEGLKRAGFISKKEPLEISLNEKYMTLFVEDTTDSSTATVRLPYSDLRLTKVSLVNTEGIFSLPCLKYNQKYFKRAAESTNCENIKICLPTGPGEGPAVFETPAEKFGVMPIAE